MRSSHLVVVAVVALGSLSVAHPSAAQGNPGVIEDVYPEQIVPGQTTTLHVAIPNGRQNVLSALEITPATGITVGAVKPGELREGVMWYEVPVTVAKDAPAGKRSLVAVGTGGRTAPADLTVPDHMLTISNLKPISAPADGKTVQFQYTAAEQGNGQLGAEPLSWFMLICGKAPEVGVVRGKAANGIVTATIPHPKTITGAAAPSYSPKCELRVHATDAAGVESNTITAPLEFK